ncbi:MAG TPA: hypothetical protein PK816_12215, partial [Candidatus Cloacimonadota bacterium]|nr:hypothetical protein [Candidatus Cloacimonadota bacterium]
ANPYEQGDSHYYDTLLMTDPLLCVLCALCEKRFQNETQIEMIALCFSDLRHFASLHFANPYEQGDSHYYDTLLMTDPLLCVLCALCERNILVNLFYTTKKSACLQN